MKFHNRHHANAGTEALLALVQWVQLHLSILGEISLFWSDILRNLGAVLMKILKFQGDVCLSGEFWSFLPHYLTYYKSISLFFRSGIDLFEKKRVWRRRER